MECAHPDTAAAVKLALRTEGTIVSGDTGLCDVERADSIAISTRMQVVYLGRYKALPGVCAAW